MLHDLLHHYEAHASPSRAQPPIDPLPFLSLGNNCTAKTPWDFTPWDRLKDRWGRNRRKVLARRVPLPQDVGRRKAPAWEVHVFTSGETAAIVRACRRRRVLPVGMLLAAGLVTQREALGRRDMVSVSGCPLDIRHHFEGPQGTITGGELGNFLTRLIRPYRIGAQTDFWRLAGRISEDASHTINRGLPRSAYVKTRGEPLSPGAHRPALNDPEAVARGRPHLDVHQAGIAPFRPAYANLHVKGCIQLTRRLHPPAGFLLRIGAITVHNRLQIFLDPVEYLDPDFVATFHRGLVSTLTKVAEVG